VSEPEWVEKLNKSLFMSKFCGMGLNGEYAFHDFREKLVNLLKQYFKRVELVDYDYNYDLGRYWLRVKCNARVLSYLLEVDVPVSRAMYKPLPGDIAVVARLKKRLEKPEDVKNVSIDDLEFIIVEYHRP